MRSRLAVALALVIAGAGCHNYVKAGDKAAAIGNWKQAEAEYRVAVHKKPEDKALREKWEKAKSEALNQAKGRAQRCIEEKNWDCAQQEGDYAATIGENDPVAQQLKRQARTGRALHHLSLARAQIDTNVAHVFQLVDFAKGLSSDEAVVREAQSVAAAAVDAAIKQADALRRDAGAAGSQGGPMLDSAIAMLQSAARVDPARVNPILTQTIADKQRWIAMEYERIARDGDAALSRHEWANAIAIYQQAEALKPGGRAQSGIKYATLVSSGDSATSARDFAAATTAYSQAMTLPEDRDRYAAAQHDRVVLRRWKLRLDSVLVHPLKPDGLPWAGNPSRTLAEMAGVLLRNPSNFHAINRLPVENHPTVVLEVTLPDGRKFRTAPVRGIYAKFPADVVLDSNAFEDRTLDVRALHHPAGGAPVEIDVIRIPIRDVIAGARTAPAGKSILRFDLALEPAAGMAEGVVGGMTPVPNETNLTDTPSQPVPGATGFALTRVEAVVKGAPVPQGGNAPTSPRVEILQRGTVVYRSPETPKGSALDASPRAVYVFVDPNEALTVRILDGSSPAGEGRVTAAALRSGVAEVGNAQSAWAKLSVAPRRSGP